MQSATNVVPKPRPPGSRFALLSCIILSPFSRIPFSPSCQRGPLRSPGVAARKRSHHRVGASASTPVKPAGHSDGGRCVLRDATRGLRLARPTRQRARRKPQPHPQDASCMKMPLIFPDVRIGRPMGNRGKRIHGAAVCGALNGPGSVDGLCVLQIPVTSS